MPCQTRLPWLHTFSREDKTLVDKEVQGSSNKAGCGSGKLSISESIFEFNISGPQEERENRPVINPKELGNVTTQIFEIIKLFYFFAI